MPARLPWLPEFNFGRRARQWPGQYLRAGRGGRNPRTPSFDTRVCGAHIVDQSLRHRWCVVRAAEAARFAGFGWFDVPLAATRFRFCGVRPAGLPDMDDDDDVIIVSVTSTSPSSSGAGGGATGAAARGDANSNFAAGADHAASGAAHPEAPAATDHVGAAAAPAVSGVGVHTPVSAGAASSRAACASPSRHLQAAAAASAELAAAAAPAAAAVDLLQSSSAAAAVPDSAAIVDLKHANPSALSGHKRSREVAGLDTVSVT